VSGEGKDTYHHISAVEDQRQEECKSTEIHVALRVELAGLDFHALRAQDSGSTENCESKSLAILQSDHLPAVLVLCGLNELDLDPVAGHVRIELGGPRKEDIHPIDAVKEQDQNEYECDFQAIL
jgi:hypothetical protein